MTDNESLKKLQADIQKLLEADTDDFMVLGELIELNPRQDLVGADLHETNLSGINLKDADLRDTNLKDANLSDANLKDADLSDANLKDADLRNANLIGANLTDVDLSGTEIEEAQFGSNLGISNQEAKKQDLINRGAILIERGAVFVAELTGKGEIIAVADTGLDIGEIAMLHPDFRGRVKIIKSYPIRPSESTRVHNPGDDDGASDKYSGYGTQVAGSILGSGETAQKFGLPPIQGVAPEAELIFQAVEQTPKWTRQQMISFLKCHRIPPASDLLGIPSNLKTLFEFAYNNGAQIHSNSWGGGEPRSYNRRCRHLDEFVWQHKDFLIVFAAGNEDNTLGYITPPGTAKNCLTVGACENDRASEFSKTDAKWLLQSHSMVDAIQDNATFSSRGPCQDGRRKPDVVAPGTFILSTRSSQIKQYSKPRYSLAIGHYMYMSGTSLATPLVAGSAALVRQYLRTQKGNFNPSAALLKAALIHSAEYIPYRYAHEDSQKWADNEQGWGSINLSRIINLPSPHQIVFFDQSQGLASSGKAHKYTIEISNNSIPLRATLVYTDYPGPQLVNNLNLSLISPAGKYYRGNDFEGQGTKDEVNNVEGCIIESPELGTWKIEILGSHISESPQDYALVISGAFVDWKQVS